MRVPQQELAPPTSSWNIPRFPSSPLIIRVPIFLLFGFNQGTPKEKGQKGTTGEPRFQQDQFQVQGRIKFGSIIQPGSLLGYLK